MFHVIVSFAVHCGVYELLVRLNCMVTYYRGKLQCITLAVEDFLDRLCYLATGAKKTRDVVGKIAIPQPSTHFCIEQEARTIHGFNSHACTNTLV